MYCRQHSTTELYPQPMNYIYGRKTEVLTETSIHLKLNLTSTRVNTVLIRIIMQIAESSLKVRNLDSETFEQQ